MHCLVGPTAKKSAMFLRLNFALLATAVLEALQLQQSLCLHVAGQTS